MIRVPSALGAPDATCAPCAACPSSTGSDVAMFALGFGSSLLAQYVFYMMVERKRRS